MIALVVAQCLSMASPLSAPVELFQRSEPNLEAGASSLAHGDVDAAIESFRKAEPKTGNERAIVEYDVGSAHLVRAQKAAQGEDKKPDAAALDDARSAFERAMGLADDTRLKSEAALAAGNVLAQKGELDDAIAMLRKSVVADPSNERARKNLRRVLDAKRAQPPPPEQQEGDGEESKDKDKKEDDKKEEKNDQKSDDKQGGDEKDQSDQKKDEKGQKENDKEQKESGEKKDQSGAEEGDKKEEPKKQKKADARRLLDALRSRERPMTPLEVRGQKKPQPPKDGKDW